MQTSRILERNRGGFARGEGGGVRISLPTSIRRGEVPSERVICEPFAFANYVIKLHYLAGLECKFPHGAFMKLAKECGASGYIELYRAAYEAASVARHPFSPRFLKKFIAPPKVAPLLLF